MSKKPQKPKPNAESNERLSVTAEDLRVRFTANPANTEAGMAKCNEQMRRAAEQIAKTKTPLHDLAVAAFDFGEAMAKVNQIASPYDEDDDEVNRP